MRSLDLVNGAPVRVSTVNRILAVVAWCIGAVTTYLGILGMSGAPWLVAASFAVVAQVLLTWAERAMWHGRPTLVGALALLFDVALNAGGVYAFVRRIGETPTGLMLSDVFGGSAIGPIPAMIVALVVGFLIAAAPEELWTRKD